MVASDKIKGIFKVKTENGEVGFKFGMMTWFLLSKNHNLNITQLQEQLVNGDISVMLLIFQAANEAYASLNNSVSPMSIEEIAEVFDEVGIEEMTKILEGGMDTFGKKTPKKRRVKDKPLNQSK